MNVQGPGFEHVFDHVLDSHKKSSIWFRFSPRDAEFELTLGSAGDRLSTPECKEVFRAPALQGDI